MVGNAQAGSTALFLMEVASPTWLADKIEYGYFLSQPSLPPCEVMVVRAALAFAAPARPVCLLRLAFLLASSPPPKV